MSDGYGHNEQAFAASFADAFDVAGLSDLVFTSLGTQIDQIAPDGPVRQRVIALMQWAEREGREGDLVDAVARARRRRSDVQASVKAVRAHLDRVAEARWYQSPNSFETCFVRTDWPFVDRRSLRDGLSALIAVDPPRTLVVRGPSGSGRTYSRHLVTHVAEREQHAVCPVDVTTLDPGFTAEEIARLIVYRVGRGQGIEYQPSGQSTGARHNMELANWLVSEVDQTARTWWLLLDGLDKVDVRPETLDFIVHLMTAAEYSAPQLRVVLLGCGDVLPPELEELSFPEEIQGIQREMLEEFFRRFAEHMNIEVADEHIEQTVDKVLANAPADDPERLRAIHGAVRQVARAFAEAPALSAGE